MSGQADTKGFKILKASDVDFSTKDLSFFEPYLGYYVKQTLEIGGEAYVSRAPDGDFSGIFIYDEYGKKGKIFTRTRKVFDYYCELKPFDYLFAEIQTGPECETYDIYTVDLDNLAIVHRFRRENHSNGGVAGRRDRTDHGFDSSLSEQEMGEGCAPGRGKMFHSPVRQRNCWLWIGFDGERYRKLALYLCETAI